ncbi:MAG TPA: UTP--glucose-1-phosphate uridylyltransferase GalU, partial [Methanofastidiosum sp.]|nr:UTP--glucose-1-phosphate uridylyltransferase GalU [Methanofastidiosum sp.]
MKDFVGKVKKAVIPAAGFGTRFLPATKAMPKEMLPIVDKPVIQYVVEEASKSGIEDIIIITGKNKRAIEDHFDISFELDYLLEKNGKNQIKKTLDEISALADIHFIRQKKQKGLGDAIYCARKHIGEEPFAVLLGDDIFQSKTPCIKQLIESYNKYKSSIVALETISMEKISNYGVIQGTRLDEKTYEIVDLIEKPKLDEAPSNLAISGRYILTPYIFECIENINVGVNNEIQLTDSMK